MYHPVGAPDSDYHSRLNLGYLASCGWTCGRGAADCRAIITVLPLGAEGWGETMIWALRAMAVLSLVGATVVFGLCASDWMENDQESEQVRWRSAVDMFADSEYSHGGLAKVETVPLIRQAEVLASYLKPVAVREGRPPVSPQPAPAFLLPGANPPAPSPTFKLCGTSYCQSRPQESRALISIGGGPATDQRWVKTGAQVGHFVIQEIRPSVIVYRSQGGGQALQMRVDHGPPSPGLVRRHVPTAANANLVGRMPLIGSEPDTTVEGAP
jgi:hypothetical protein